MEIKQHIAAGTVVEFHYVLTSDAGDVLDRSEEGEPLQYLHGAGNIVPGLEEALAGKLAGDSFQVSVPPHEAYGLRDAPGPNPVARSAFPDEAEIEPGMQFAAHGQDGNPVPVWVTDVQDDVVFIDFNHPLAGMTLNFDVSVVSVRDATAEEKAHGHPHGEGDHHHHH